MLRLVKYTPPSFAQGLKQIPTHRFNFLHNLMTPIEPMRVRGRSLRVKRDDFIGGPASGNKIRKLEFLLADAVKQGADCIITIGGLHSNHARATALLARRVGLESHLILRSACADDELPLVMSGGNALLDRLAGAHINLVSREEYSKHGQHALLEKLSLRLRQAGKTPYVIPVGGSTVVGLWGYLEAIRELQEQQQQREESEDEESVVSRIVFACGSGSTAAGIALGSHLAEMNLDIHAIAVCDSASAFYDHVDETIAATGAASQTSINQLFSARSLLTVNDKFKGRYVDHERFSSDEELSLVTELAQETGVLFDPCYTVKAMRALLEDDSLKGNDAGTLFWHTGGYQGISSVSNALQKKDFFKGSIANLLNH